MRISAPFPRTRERAAMGAPPGRRGWLWLLLPVALLAIVGTILWRLQTPAAPPATTTASVSQGDLAITVTGSGAVAAARTIDMPFQQAGTITAVNVKVGDQVKAGQVLAQVDDSDLKLALAQAQANAKSAEAKLQQLRTGTVTQTDIASAKAAVAAAQAKLNALRNPTAADLSAARAQLAQAQANLETTRNNQSQNKTSAYTQMQQAAENLTAAQTKYASAKADWDYVQATGNDPQQPTKTDAQGRKVPNKLNDAQQRQYRDAFITAEAALHNAEQAVRQAQVAYDTARQNEAVSVPLAEQQVANAQTQLDALRHPSASDIAQAQAAVIQAQANLANLTKPATDADIAAAEAAVTQAQAAVTTAERNLARAALTAPFDGVISAVNIQVGGTVGTSSAAFTLVDRSTLHVNVNLSESDAAKVQPGQTVSLTFDALPGVKLQGKVVTVAPSATVQQNVVTYPTEVEFDPGDAPVRVGMSATAEILVQRITNAILVPSRAVQTAGGIKTVTVLQGEKQIPVTVPVETGVTSNGQTQILSCSATGTQCLQPGDRLQVAQTATATGASSGTGSQNRIRGGPDIVVGPRPFP